MIEKSIKNGIRIYQKRHRTDKNKSIIDNSNKITNAIKLFKSMIDNNEFKTPGEYNDKPNNNIDLSWINYLDGYKEIAREADSDYVKEKNDNELKLIKDFITKINNGAINNKNKAGNEFRKIKQKVTNDILRQNNETDRDTQRTFAPSSLPKKDYSAETDEYLKYMKEQEKDRKKFSDEYDSNGWSSGSGLKILTNKQMLNRLPVLLAQIQAGNNSKKLKNELRHILYSLYRSKALTKTVYNNLIKVIRQSASVYDTNKMETFFMNTKNSRTNEPNRFKYDLINKLDLKNLNKNMTLVNLSIYYTWKNVKSIYNNNKFKISAPTWSQKFDLPDGSYNIPEIQDYFEYIIKKHETIAKTAPILIYANNVVNRIVFKIKTGYNLKLLSKETMKLLGSTSNIIDADKNSENVTRLENVEVILVHCNLVNNSYQQHSRVLLTFVPNKQYGQLISISSHSLVFLKTMNTDFSEIEIWFTDQNNNALTNEDNVNISLIINTS